MPSYIAESYQSRARRDELSSLTQRARDAAQALTEAGQPVQYLRSAFLPEDEVLLLWFIACSRAVVTDVGRVAEFEFDRVIEELEPPQRQEEPCAHEST
jgi:hypothetical protein